MENESILFMIDEENFLLQSYFLINSFLLPQIQLFPQGKNPISAIF